MVRKTRGAFCLLAVAMLCVAMVSGCGKAERRTAVAPMNVIIMIGDGMGFEHVKAAGLYASGEAGSLCMETLPYKAQAMTTPVPPANLQPGKVNITDSAAAATALATGHKVYNGVISMAIPGDSQPYQTVLESFKAQGKRTGLVTTAYITDATPAGFGAHSSGRQNGSEIVDCYLKTVRPDVILGGGYSNKEMTLTAEMVEAAGYKAVTNREQLAAATAGKCDRLFGVFGKGNIPYEVDKVAAATQPSRADILTMPSLTEMTAAALKTVPKGHKGFFLMIEGGLIDKAAHKNDLERSVPETVEFDRAVRMVMKWAHGRKDTLVIVTADHETGGLAVVKGKGQGQLPEVTWSTGGHTGVNVPVFAWGVGAEKVKGVMDNTDVYRLMMGTYAGRPVEKCAAEVPAAAKSPASEKELQTSGVK